MITGRRIRERQAAERAGELPPPPPHPETISYQQHLAEVARINKAHALELANLRKQGGSGEELARVRTLLEQVTGERDELAAQLEDLTKPEGGEAGSGGGSVDQPPAEGSAPAADAPAGQGDALAGSPEAPAAPAAPPAQGDGKGGKGSRRSR